MRIAVLVASAVVVVTRSPYLGQESVAALYLLHSESLRGLEQVCVECRHLAEVYPHTRGKGRLILQHLRHLLFMYIVHATKCPSVLVSS